RRRKADAIGWRSAFSLNFAGERAYLFRPLHRFGWIEIGVVAGQRFPLWRHGDCFDARTTQVNAQRVSFRFHVSSWAASRIEIKTRNFNRRSVLRLRTSRRPRRVPDR